MAHTLRENQQRKRTAAQVRRKEAKQKALGVTSGGVVLAPTADGSIKESDVSGRDKQFHDDELGRKRRREI